MTPSLKAGLLALSRAWRAVRLAIGPPREWRPGPCYARLRASYQRATGERLTLPGETGNWPERGAPFDGYDGEGNLLGADAWAEQKRMREGHA